MRNLGAEARRLTSKAGGTDGLSAGQAAQLAKDEAAVEALLPLIEEDEEALRARLIARGIVNEPAGGLGRGISAHESKFDDDEDVADTTAHHRPPKQAAGAAPVLKLRVVKAGRDAAADASAAPRRINAASLNPRVIQASTPAPSPAAAVAAGAAVPATETLASLQEQLVRARARLLELDSEDQSSADAVQNSAAAAATATAGGDELDSYMAATAAAVHDREAAARLAERRSLEAQVNRIDDLLAAVANAAGADVVEAAAAAAAPTLSEPTAAALPAGSKRKRDAAPEDAADSPASSAPTSATSSATASVERRTGPPPPRMAATGVAAALRTVMQLSEADADAPAATVGRREACSGARGAAASAVSSDGGAHSSLPRAKGAGGASSFDCDEPEVKWAPPVGQTGDGRTSLNDKLGY